MNSNVKLVVKDNALIDASFNLSLVEQRLMLLAIVEAREISNLTFETPISITVKSYMEQYNVSKATAFQALKDAVDSLFERKFIYYSTKLKKRLKERWIHTAGYMDDQGHIVIFLGATVIELISRLEEQFTKYHLDQVSDFNSKYSIRLYELVIKWLTATKTEKYKYADLREKLGVSETEYKTMSLFKTNVLEKAINEINAKTDVEIKYKQYKEGRVVSHFSFNIKNKNTVQVEKEKPLVTMTVKQIDMFGDKLARLPKFQSHFQAEINESMEAYAERIKLKLFDTFYVESWKEFLIETGFKGFDT